MRIEKIRIEGDIDTFGGRALSIKTREKTFVTPLRSATSSEFNYKSKIPIEPWVDRNSDLDCDCVLCKSKNAMDFVTSHSESGTPEPTIFDAANRLHEYYTSSTEFKQSRKYIVDGELTQYFKEKDGLKNYDTDNISTLNGY